MSSSEEIMFRFPVLEGKQFQAEFFMPDLGSVGWEGSFWEVASRACTYVIQYESEHKSVSNRIKSLFGPRSQLELLERDLATGKYVDVITQPTRTDVENSNTAFYQNTPGAAWLLLKAGLTSEKEMELSLEAINSFVQATMLPIQSDLDLGIGGDRDDHFE